MTAEPSASDPAQLPNSDQSDQQPGPYPTEPLPTRQRQAEPQSEGPGGVGPMDPQRLLRIAGVTREVLEEARRIRPEPGAVEHLRRVHQQISDELRQSLPRELFEELDELTPEIHSGTLEELALAHAEILGWLEGLFQGTQLALQMQVARAMEERFKGGRSLPAPEAESTDGRYL